MDIFVFIQENHLNKRAKNLDIFQILQRIPENGNYVLTKPFHISIPDINSYRNIKLHGFNTTLHPIPYLVKFSTFQTAVVHIFFSQFQIPTEI